jgi:sulfoxide reductase heme-binding subunit YedZ
MLHALIYLTFDQSFEWGSIATDILKRPWLTVGFFSLVLMMPLAATSTNGMMRRLGRNWQRLHRLIYPIAVGAVLHYFWLVKKDITDPTLYAVLLAILLCARLIEGRKRRPARAGVSRQPAVPSVE